MLDGDFEGLKVLRQGSSLATEGRAKAENPALLTPALLGSFPRKETTPAAAVAKLLRLVRFLVALATLYRSPVRRVVLPEPELHLVGLRLLFVDDLLRQLS